MATEQHSLLRSVALHLLPGVFILLLFVLIAPASLRAGLPPLVPVLLAAIPGLAFQLWHLLRMGRTRTGRWSLDTVVVYREPLAGTRHLLVVFVVVVLAFLANGLAAPIGTALLAQMPWLPSWFEIRDLTVLRQYPKPVILWTYVLLYLPINGVAGPIIEEWYFRGYLMPRLSRFGRGTPVLAVLLFTLYHFWQPYYWPAQFLGILPLAYAVWFTRSVRFGIVVHVLLNIVGGGLSLALVLGG